jgi:hypothetical protein
MFHSTSWLNLHPAGRCRCRTAEKINAGLIM